MKKNPPKHLTEKQYRIDDQVISAVEDFFEDKNDGFYTTGIQALQHRRKKCVDLVKFNHIIVSIWTFQPTLVCYFLLPLRPPS